MKRYITTLLTLIALVAPGVTSAAGPAPEMCQEYLEQEMVREAPCSVLEQVQPGTEVVDYEPAQAVEPAPSVPISFHSEPSTPLPKGGLSLAQARWFVEREARKWPESPARYMHCWRLTAATDACSFWSRSGITPAIRRKQPLRKTTELVEYTGAPIRMWLANQHPLTRKEVEALEGH